MRLVAMVLSATFLVACGDPGVVQSVDDVSVLDAVNDTAGFVEPDVTVLDVGEPDVAMADTSTACEPGEGCFGESCAEPDDCLSGICTMHLGDKVCSKTCDETCPQGFTCTLVGSGGDGQYVCMSNFSHLCLPCSDAGTCSGETPNACVKYADGTRFCGGSCDLENPCPSGYACQEVETADGVNSYQCVNTAGVCPCSNLAIDSALATSCEVGNEQGVCVGVRVCEESGLSECTATEPVPEVCNGLDDDCNGLADDGTCDDGNDCTVDTCEGEGGCKHEPLTEGECLDGDACTVADHCEEGICVGSPVDCNDDNPCTVDSCDGLGGCTFEPVVQACDDGDACTLGDLCTEGQCTGSAILTCDDGNACTDDSCGEAGCVFEPNALECDDGNACSSGDSCQAGVCQGVQVVCDDDNLCTTDSCDIQAGCLHVKNTQPCNDGDACTQGDTCADGACAPGVAATCNDGNPCTDDACDATLGCVFSANTLDCDDTNSCTTGDSCLEGNCIGLGDLSCDDGNPCTEDTCLADGGCSHTKVVGLCSDGDACTLNDTCVEGACVSGVEVSCDDGNPCTDEVCNSGDCVFTPNVDVCDDGNACTSKSLCEGGACVASEILDCDDKNACTSDGCDLKLGCVHTPNAIQCTDGDPCTVGDGCTDGACKPGAGALACDDGNPCTDDSCQKADGCVFVPNSVACEDGDLCTVGDACAAGVCQSGGGVLDCDDGLFCNGEESCDSDKGCLQGNPPTADDGVSCTLDSCDEATDTVVSSPEDGLCPVPPGTTCKVGICDPVSGCELGNLPNCCGNGVVEGSEACDEGGDTPNCTAQCTKKVAYHMNGKFYVSDATYAGDFNAGGGFCTKMVGQVAYIAGNNAPLPNDESPGTWNGNGNSSNGATNCFLYTSQNGEGYGVKGGYSPCSQKRKVVCSTDPAYCNGYGLNWCHLWD